MFLKPERTSTKFQVPWKLKDILIVFLISSFAGLLSLSDYVILFIGLFLKDTSGQKLLIYYLFGMIILLTPIIWVNKIYKAKIETLGIRKGRWSLSLTIIIGIGAGVAYYFPALAIQGLSLDFDRFLTKCFVAMSSIQIFGDIFSCVLTPIAEEVVDRGFIYGYLRKRLPVLFALVVQSIVFALSHGDLIMSNNPIPQIIHKFILGLILGALYEVSASLYPAMVCHGTFNFLSARIPVSMGSNFWL